MNIVFYISFLLITSSLHAQHDNGATMAFLVRHHKDTSTVYHYRRPYLTRKVQLYTGTRKPMVGRIDSIYIDNSRYSELKNYVHQYKEENKLTNLICRARYPIHAGFRWREKKAWIKDDYYPCYTDSLPTRFVEMKRFLDSLFVQQVTELPAKKNA